LKQSIDDVSSAVVPVPEEESPLCSLSSAAAMSAPLSTSLDENHHDPGPPIGNNATLPETIPYPPSEQWVENPSLETRLSGLSLLAKELPALDSLSCMQGGSPQYVLPADAAAVFDGLCRDSPQLTQLALQQQAQQPFFNSEFLEREMLMSALPAGDIPEKKKRRKYRRTKDCDLPKKPKTPYTFFQLSVMEQTWAEVEAANPTDKSREQLSRMVARITGQRWRSMSAEERKRFNDLAASDSERYKLECVEYARKNGIADTQQLSKLLKLKGGGEIIPRKSDGTEEGEQEEGAMILSNNFDINPFMDTPQLPLEILEVWRLQLESGVDPLASWESLLLPTFRPNQT